MLKPSTTVMTILITNHHQN